MSHSQLALLFGHIGIKIGYNVDVNLMPNQSTADKTFKHMLNTDKKYF